MTTALSMSLTLAALVALTLFPLATSLPTAVVDPDSWGYNAARGSAQWGLLSPQFSKCGSGSTQSPINILQQEIAAAKPAFPSVSWPQLTNVTVNNTGHGIEFASHDKLQRTVTVEGTQYALAQFHFHTPGEHRIDGHYADAEMHLVHKDSAGNTLVIGFRINTSQRASVDIWDNVIKHMPPSKASPPGHLDTLDIRCLAQLAAANPYFSYVGSLTAPPCTENVRWYVSAAQLTMTLEQLEDVRARLGFNARETQFNQNVATARAKYLGIQLPEDSPVSSAGQ
ncbi:hypothetical protein RI367_004089 [Sorochytrium milnesiophthora]